MFHSDSAFLFKTLHTITQETLFVSHKLLFCHLPAICLLPLLCFEITWSLTLTDLSENIGVLQQLQKDVSEDCDWLILIHVVYLVRGNYD